MDKKMTDIKLIALDLDGTLLNAEKEIPERNAQALRMCAERGIKIALISGRAFEGVCGFARQMGIEPIVAACNGAQIAEGVGREPFSETVFEESVARRILNTIHESGMYFNVYTRGRCYMGNGHVRASLGPRYAHHIPGIECVFGLPYERVWDEERLMREGATRIQKFVVMGMPDDEGFARIEEKLADLRLSVSSASKRNREFMPTGVDKGFAVRKICARFGISTDQVMAFGDQTNDLPMLAAAGFPVCMENGEEIVKKAARLIAPDHSLGGVGIVLEKYVPGDEKP